MPCPPTPDAGTVDDAGSLPGVDAPEPGRGAPGTSDAPPLRLPSTPGMVRCGNAMCDAVNAYCCSGAGGSGGGGFETCSPTFCGYRRECDETADCVGTEVCCYSVVASPPAILASSCVQRDQCAYDGSWIACGTQEDCSSVGAPPCVAQSCGGATLQSFCPITRSACR
jgi:hypothetical protein